MQLSGPQPNFFVLELKQVPQNSLDLVTALSFELGACGSEEELNFEQENLAYEPIPIQKELTDVKFYFHTAPHPSELESLRQHCRSLNILQEQNRDWMEEWKKHFEPFALTGPYWIVPSWREVPPQCERPILIDPGMAFGTGTHETTQLACDLVVEAMTLKPKSSVVDIGTGTGILSIVASKEGASPILANDVDPEARRVARENFLKNGLDPLKVTDFSASEIPGQFDMVTANILDYVLLQISDSLVNLKKSDGFLIVSGILATNEQNFIRDFFTKHNLKIHKRLSRNEWVAFLVS